MPSPGTWSAARCVVLAQITAGAIAAWRFGPHPACRTASSSILIAVTIGAPAAITSCGCSGSRRQKWRMCHLCGRAGDHARPQAWALQIWKDSIDPHGTLAERYLASRKLELPDDAARFIRFHAACPWTDDRDVRVRVPALVALFRTIGGDEPSAIQRTALRGDASKIGRKMLGPAGGCAIKVTCDEDVLFRLGVAEGLESAMSANALGQGPSWALGSAGVIRNLSVLPGIETLALIAEHDRANEEAREVCAARWYDAAREVLIVEPANHACKDLNDVLRRVAR